MIKLEKGAPVRVRLHTGEVVEAVYDEPSRTGEKEHWVETKEMGFMVASSCITDNEIHVRFVGPSCDLVPVWVSV